MPEPRLIPFAAPDGLALAAREWPGPRPGSDVVLCLHGLTRNSRDFEVLGQTLAAHYRVLAPDQRGRGRSSYDPDPQNYNVPLQVRDTWRLLDHLGIGACVVVGTSMGALMAVAMANERPDRVTGLVLNDAGPEVDPRGLARIAGYVGQGGPAASWDDAAERLKTAQGASYPTYGADDWLRLARATYVEDAQGLRPDYDPDLSRAFAVASGAGVDMWPAFAVCAAVPTLLLRGALSDILARETAEAMVSRFRVGFAEVADRGHAPDLTEPDAVRAIGAFLAAGAGGSAKA